MKTTIIFLSILLLFAGCNSQEKFIEAKIITETYTNLKPNQEIINIILRNNKETGYEEEQFNPNQILNTNIEDSITMYEVRYTNKIIWQLSDNNPFSYWKTAGEGINDFIVFEIEDVFSTNNMLENNLPYGIKIRNGNARSEKHFNMYNRIKRMRFECYEVPFYWKDFDTEITIIKNHIKLFYELIFELEDTTNWQIININIKLLPLLSNSEYGITKGGFVTFDTIGRLVIEDVYRGDTNNTCISDIRWLYLKTNQ